MPKKSEGEQSFIRWLVEKVIVPIVVALVGGGGLIAIVVALRTNSSNVPSPTPSTGTPRPIPMPTATIDADQTVYDNFDNPEFDGNFNQDLWMYRTLEFDQIIQQDGILIVIRDQEPEESTGLSARRYHRISLSTLISTPIFFEAKLKLSSDKRGGNVQLQLDSGEDWWTQCTISYDGERAQANCNETGQNYAAVGKRVDYGTWHTFRIEVDSSAMVFNYYIDGQMVGSVPIDTEGLRNTKFSLGIGVYGSGVTDYIDDVRIGRVGQ